MLHWVSEYDERNDDQSLTSHENLFAGYAGAKHKFTRRVEPNEVGALIHYDQ